MSFGGFGTQQQKRQPGEIIFHPLNPEEYNIPEHQGGAQIAQRFGFRPKPRTYICGDCGHGTTGRVLCDLIRESDEAIVSWCLCSANEQHPAIIIEKDGAVIAQHPPTREFTTGENWPRDLSELYEEASKAFSAAAYTACAMVCRKILMATACENGEKDGKTFAEYVKFITDSVLTFPKAKPAIDKIRGIGNDANHHIAFVAEPDARKAMGIVTYMLNAIYSLPNA